VIIATIPGGKPISVRAAARAYRKAEPARVFSHFATQVFDSKGKLRYSTGHRHNLTTDTASGYTCRRDWQAKAMGGGLGAFFGATATGAASASSATTLTNGSAAFPTTNQGLAGMIVAVGPNSSGTGSTVFGVIVSNTATVLTVDQWYNPATGAAGTTPNATGNYQILPGQMPAMFLALTADAVAPAATDTTLASEITTNGLSRALAVWAHTAASTTYTLQKTFTCTGGSTTINKEAVFGACNTTGGGVMPFESAEPSPPTLVTSDTLQQTITVTIN
jgi:cyclophilin family peptidyl-prolyl cis-trans isomerase